MSESPKKFTTENNGKEDSADVNSDDSNPQESFNSDDLINGATSPKLSKSKSKILEEKYRQMMLVSDKMGNNEFNGYQNKSPDLETIKKDMNESIFIPHFNLIPSTKESKDESGAKKPYEHRYKLYYGPLNVFMFITYFYSVYERVLKAQELVKNKVSKTHSLQNYVYN